MRSIYEYEPDELSAFTFADEESRDRFVRAVLSLRRSPVEVSIVDVQTVLVPRNQVDRLHKVALEQHLEPEIEDLAAADLEGDDPGEKRDAPRRIDLASWEALMEDITRDLRRP